MSDMLTRLVARAQGSTVCLRPRPRLRFAPAPQAMLAADDGWGEVTGVATAAPEPAAAGPPVAPPPARTQQPRPAPSAAAVEDIAEPVRAPRTSPNTSEPSGTAPSPTPPAGERAPKASPAASLKTERIETAPSLALPAGERAPTATTAAAPSPPVASAPVVQRRRMDAAPATPASVSASPPVVPTWSPPPVAAPSVRVEAGIDPVAPDATRAPFAPPPADPGVIRVPESSSPPSQAAFSDSPAGSAAPPPVPPADRSSRPNEFERSEHRIPPPVASIRSADPVEPWATSTAVPSGKAVPAMPGPSAPSRLPATPLVSERADLRSQRGAQRVATSQADPDPAAPAAALVRSMPPVLTDANASSARPAAVAAPGDASQVTHAPTRQDRPPLTEALVFSPAATPSASRDRVDPINRPQSTDIRARPLQPSDPLSRPNASMAHPGRDSTARPNPPRAPLPTPGREPLAASVARSNAPPSSRLSSTTAFPPEAAAFAPDHPSRTAIGRTPFAATRPSAPPDAARFADGPARNVHTLPDTPAPSPTQRRNLAPAPVARPGPPVGTPWPEPREPARAPAPAPAERRAAPTGAGDLRIDIGRIDVRLPAVAAARKRPAAPLPRPKPRGGPDT